MPYAITPFLVYFAIPAAMTIAILRRRLFDIDVIISRPLLTIAAAVAIALVFQPLRQRASLLANRLVYGNRATPYQVDRLIIFTLVSRARKSTVWQGNRGVTSAPAPPRGGSPKATGRAWRSLC